MPNPHDDNSGIHIDRIVNSVSCNRHAAETGQACWNVPSARGIMRAICDRRARNAGANGHITPYITPAERRINQKKEHSA